MKAQDNNSPHPLTWITGIAIILFCTTGIAALAGVIPNSLSCPGDGTEFINIDPPQPGAAATQPGAATSQPGAAMSTRARAPSALQSRTAPLQVAVASPVHRRCTECGVIESMREVETSGEGTGLGAVGGAVVGGILGSQIGSGHGQDAATVAGAVGGVVAGNEIEKRMRSTKGYEITVRLDDGSGRVIREAHAPTWRTGDRVRIVDSAIRLN